MTEKKKARSFDEKEIEIIISEWIKYPCLYEKVNPGYHDKNKRDIAKGEIAKAVNETFEYQEDSEKFVSGECFHFPFHLLLLFGFIIFYVIIFIIRKSILAGSQLSKLFLLRAHRGFKTFVTLVLGGKRMPADSQCMGSIFMDSYYFDFIYF